MDIDSDNQISVPRNSADQIDVIVIDDDSDEEDGSVVILKICNLNLLETKQGVDTKTIKKKHNKSQFKDVKAADSLCKDVSSTSEEVCTSSVAVQYQQHTSNEATGIMNSKVNVIPVTNNIQRCSKQSVSFLQQDTMKNAVNEKLDIGELDDPATDKMIPDEEMNAYETVPKKDGIGWLSDTSTSEKLFYCPVLNCNLKFSSKSKIHGHMTEYNHNPCNPFENIVDAKLSNKEVAYLCPECRKDYKDKAECRSHQLLASHMLLVEPLAICGFFCPECFQFFIDDQHGRNHMNEMKHGKCPFHLNLECVNKVDLLPAPSLLVNSFRSKCQSVAFTVNCVDCHQQVITAEDARGHLEQQHVLTSMSQSTPCEVFVSYLGNGTCTVCQQIFLVDNDKMFGLKHFCFRDQSGIIIPNNCKTFSEYVFRCGLTKHIEQLRITSRSALFENPCVPTVKTPMMPLALNIPQNVLIPRNRFSQPALPQYKPRFLIPQSNSFCFKRKGVADMTNQNKKPKIDSKKCNNMFMLKNRATSNSRNGYSALNGKLHMNFASTAKPLMFVGNGAAVRTLSVGCEKNGPQNLNQMKHILFLDLDNWSNFFKKLPSLLPDWTFVWAFYGGRSVWFEPQNCAAFLHQKKNGWFYLHEKCGNTKDAADFALVLQVGKLDERLPKSIPFSILSGDKGFYEVERQMKKSRRRTVVINPHRASQFSNEMLLWQIKSVTTI